MSKTSKVENIYKAAYFPNFVLFIFPLKVPALLNRSYSLHYILSSPLHYFEYKSFYVKYWNASF